VFWRKSKELCYFIRFKTCGSRFLAIHGEWPGVATPRARVCGKQAGASPAHCGDASLQDVPRWPDDHPFGHAHEFSPRRDTAPKDTRRGCKSGTGRSSGRLIRRAGFWGRGGVGRVFVTCRWGGSQKKRPVPKNKKSSRLFPSLIRMASIVSTDTARQAGFGWLSSKGC
jgi:hypothetical protein